MTLEELIMYLTERIGKKDLNVRSQVTMGSSWERRLPLAESDISIRDGEVFINTYEGM